MLAVTLFPCFSFFGRYCSDIVFINDHDRDHPMTSTDYDTLKTMTCNSKPILDDVNVHRVTCKEANGIKECVVKALNLSNCGLDKIPKQVNDLTNLERLILSDNKITKIEGVDTLPNLEELDLGGNKITKIEGVDTLPNLKWLDLRGNEITMSDCEAFDRQHDIKNVLC